MALPRRNLPWAGQTWAGQIWAGQDLGGSDAPENSIHVLAVIDTLDQFKAGTRGKPLNRPAKQKTV
jgi:hypothetical protein